MNWDKVERQEFIVRVLRSHVESERVSSAYLFSGTPESGKEDMAMAFACALNCEREHIFEECESSCCHKVMTANHPDVKWVGDHEEAKIKIEEVRDLSKWVYLKPYEGRYKVFIIIGAERLTTEASNALLKTIEEPPEQTIFCLLTESRSHMLETIQSRTFELRFRSFVEEEEPTLSVLQDELINVGEIPWEQFLESFEGMKRELLKDELFKLSQYFRAMVEQGASGGTLTGEELSGYLEAMDAVYEVRQAVDGNANQKLSLSYLAMKLRRALPGSKALR